MQHYSFHQVIKTFVFLVAASLLTGSLYAVPAKRGWQTRTQADGTTIEVQQFGDEFYHYMINRDGQQVREIDGMFEVVGEAPTAEVAKARRAQGVARRQRKDVGTTPNLAPKGVVILANFSDKSMQSSHNQATFDELCNSLNCTVNNGYPSAGQYFADQSKGSYRPQFDVFGPVTLSHNVAYYGKDKSQEGDDQHATTAVVEACKLADQQFSINWADYDSDNDGYVDFVYLIYAGQGQADGGSANTIWPHNWSIIEACQYGTSGYCTYPYSQCNVGGKNLDNYAMSSELSGSGFGGIGTLCHEFGHVMGLPDFYDTNYGTNYYNELTPNEWDIMDGGSYNGDGHCPPNYDPWEKFFFGWVDPVNYGNEGHLITLYANGTEDYNVVQVNASGTKQNYNVSGWNYYLENRQQSGWDKFVPAHGMVIWKVNFNASAWTSNTPNNTANAPKLTVVCSSGTKVGASNGKGNVFGGSNTSKTSWTGVSGKPVKEIKETAGVITAIYIEEPVIVPFEVTWFSNGEEFAKTESTGILVLPTDTPISCNDSKVFVGWSAVEVEETDVKPTLAADGDEVAEGAIFYAVFATPEEEGVSYSGYTTTLTCGGTGIETVQPQAAAQKVIRDGQVLIIRNGHIYTTTGQEIR